MKLFLQSDSCLLVFIRGCKTLALQTGSSEAKIPPHFDRNTSRRVRCCGVRARSCDKVLSRRPSLTCYITVESRQDFTPNGFTSSATRAHRYTGAQTNTKLCTNKGTQL